MLNPFLLVKACLKLVNCHIRLSRADGMVWLNKQVCFEPAAIEYSFDEQPDPSSSSVTLTDQVAASIESARRAVAVAAKVLPVKSHCLPRSLALAELLSGIKGVESALVRIGVRKLDLEPDSTDLSQNAFQLLSHAWVEVNGVAVCEPEVVGSEFSTLKKSGAEKIR